MAEAQARKKDRQSGFGAALRPVAILEKTVHKDCRSTRACSADLATSSSCSLVDASSCRLGYHHGVLVVTWSCLKLPQSQYASSSSHLLQILPISRTQQTNSLNDKLAEHAVQQRLHRTEP